MAWADEGKGNTNPVVILNGQKGIGQIIIDGKAGKPITLDASKSFDVEGDNLSFLWWQQLEHGSTVKISNPTASKIEVEIQDNAGSDPIHIICEVHDDGDFNLVSYRRIIIN